MEKATQILLFPSCTRTNEQALNVSVLRFLNHWREIKTVDREFEETGRGKWQKQSLLVEPFGSSSLSSPPMHPSLPRSKLTLKSNPNPYPYLPVIFFSVA
jgi:hypothetical protein